MIMKPFSGSWMKARKTDAPVCHICCPRAKPYPPAWNGQPVYSAMPRVLSPPGLPKSDAKTIDNLRYHASDLIDDLKGNRPLNEQRAVLYDLYQTMAELRLRMAGQFLGSGKHLARKLKNCDPAFAEALEAVMVRAHGPEGFATPDIGVLLSMLESLGGYLFDGYKQFAAREKRKEAVWLTDPPAPKTLRL